MFVKSGEGIFGNFYGVEFILFLLFSLMGSFRKRCFRLLFLLIGIRILMLTFIEGKFRLGMRGWIWSWVSFGRWEGGSFRVVC